MERDMFARLIIDGIENGYLTVTWQKTRLRKRKRAYQDIIDEGMQKGILIEICSGCGKPTKGRDCGCPAGTSVRFKKQNTFIEMLLAGHSISEICRTTFTQVCHICEREDCCDNTNPLVLKIRQLEKQIKELEATRRK
jgi:hypothetical protein